MNEQAVLPSLGPGVLSEVVLPPGIAHARSGEEKDSFKLGTWLGW